jgi:hypothetical protein
MLAKIVLTSISVTFLVLTSLGAQAMPMSSALSQAKAYGVTKVAGGCAVGFYRGPLGGCVRAGGGVVVAPRPVVVAPRPVVVAPPPVVVAPRTIVRPRPVVIDRRPIVIR